MQRIGKKTCRFPHEKKSKEFKATKVSSVLRAAEKLRSTFKAKPLPPIGSLEVLPTRQAVGESQSGHLMLS